MYISVLLVQEAICDDGMVSVNADCGGGFKLNQWRFTSQRAAEPPAPHACARDRPGTHAPILLLALSAPTP